MPSETGRDDILSTNNKMDWPTVAILIVTFNRPQEIRTVIAALREYLRYEGQFHWHLADDGSPGGYVAQIEHDFPSLHFTRTVTDRGGWGLNVNNAMKFLWRRGFDFIFLCEDDYKAIRDVNITDGVTLLLMQESAGMVRYGIEGHDLNLRLREVNTGGGKHSKLPYILLQKSSKQLNVYSNRPHLKHRRFHEGYGLYPVGLRLGETERKFSHDVKDKKDGPDIVVLTDGILRAFSHIGHSWKGSEFDVGVAKKKKRRRHNVQTS